MRLVIRSLFAVSLTAASLQAASPPQYLFENLGSPGGRSIGQSINDSGAILLNTTGGPGMSQYGANIYDHGVLTVLGDQYSGVAMNDSQSVTGYRRDWDYSFRYDAGVVTMIPMPYGQASAINDSGEVVLNQPTESGWNGYLYDGTMTTLPTLGGTITVTRAINDAGMVTGYSSLPGNTTLHGFVYHNGVMTDISPSAGYSQGLDINDNGLILAVGDFGVPFITDGSSSRSIPGLFEPAWGAAAINNNGWVVGSHFSRAMLWSEDFGMIDLNSLIPEGSGFTLVSALDINDHGEITGYAIPNVGGNPDHPWAFILHPMESEESTPVPEVHTYGLWLGAVMMGASIWRRRRARGSA